MAVTLIARKRFAEIALLAVDDREELRATTTPAPPPSRPVTSRPILRTGPPQIALGTLSGVPARA
jgi:hypothetical protein